MRNSFGLLSYARKKYHLSWSQARKFAYWQGRTCKVGWFWICQKINTGKNIYPLRDTIIPCSRDYYGFKRRLWKKFRLVGIGNSYLLVVDRSSTLLRHETFRNISENFKGNHWISCFFESSIQGSYQEAAQSLGEI